MLKILISTLLCLFLHSSFSKLTSTQKCKKTGNSRLFCKIDFPQIIVEEGEVYTIDLDEYVRGNLLTFDLNINQRGKNISTWNQHINISKPFQPRWSDPYGLYNSSQLHEDPFQSSSIFIETEDNYQIVYFIDRNFHFYKYNVTFFQSDSIEKEYIVKFDKSKVNNTCGNLREVRHYNKTVRMLMMTCSGMRLRNENSTKDFEIIQYMVTVDITNDGRQKPVVQYFLVPDSTTIRDDSFEILQVVPSETPDGTDRLYVLQLCSQHKDVLIYEVQFDTTLHYANFTFAGFVPFSDFYTNSTTNQQKRYLVNFAVVDQDCGIIAILDQMHGIWIAEYRNSTIPYLNCHKDRSQPRINSLLEHPDMQVLYYNPEDATTLYAAVAYPPKALEIDINDLNNPYIKKVYSLEGDESRYVGMYNLASNEDYLVQSLLEMKTFNQVLRFYQRNASHDFYAQFEVTIADMYRSNFLIFPNYNINKMMYRDEKSLNLSQILPMRLHIDFRHLGDVRQYLKLDSDLIIYNNVGEAIEETFSIQLFQKNDISTLKKNNIVPGTAIYSCGDPNFKYPLNDVYSGPHYQLEAVPDFFHTNQTVYFEVTNRKSSMAGVAEMGDKLTLKYCNFTIMDTILQEKNELTHVLICGQSNPGIIEKCEVETDMRTQESQVIHCHQTKQLIDAVIENMYYDEIDKILMVVVNTTSPLNVGGDLFYEMHFFEVGEYLVWKRVVLKGNSGQFQSLMISQYNPQIHMGTIIQNNHTYVTINIFNIDTKNYDTDLLLTTQFLINEAKNGTVIKSWISDEKFIWVLFKNNTINTYEYEYCEYYQRSQLRLVQSVYFDFTTEEYYPKLIVNNHQELYVPQDRTVICFDIMANSYFLVIYVSNSEAFVYNIQGYYLIQYKMQLPRYGPMFNTSLAYVNMSKSNYESSLVKAAKDQYLLILVEDQVHLGNMFMYLYDVSQTKRDAYMYNVTLPQHVLHRSALHLSRLGDHAVLSVFNNTQLALMELTFDSFLIVAPQQRDNLINVCIDQEIPTVVNTLKILFKCLIPVKNLHPSDMADAEIQAVNQGLVIKPLTNTINITFTNDGTQKFSSQGIVLNQVFSGKDIKFQTKCVQGKSNWCEYIEEFTEPIVSTNLIEFVTSNRQVIKQFSIGEYIFLLDSTVQLNLMMNLPPKTAFKDERWFSETGEFNNLLYLLQICQKKSFGCFMKQFSKDFDIMNTNLRTEDATHKKFFVIQCTEENTNVQMVKFVIVTLFKDYYFDSNSPRMSAQANVTFVGDSTSNIRVGNDLIQIVKLDIPPIKSGLPLSDVELIPINCGNSQKFSQDQSVTQAFYVALVFENAQQFTNYLQLFQLDIFVDQTGEIEDKSNITLLRTFQANSVGMASFIIRKLGVSFDKKYLFFTMDWFGIGIINLQFQQFVYFIDFNNFYKKQTLMYDRSLVFQGLVQYSEDCWHVVYSKGIVEIAFNMERMTQKMMFLEYTPFPLEQYLDYNFTFVQSSNYMLATEMVGNELGYVLLNYKIINDDLFETYLGFISFLTERNSMFQNEIYLMQNTKCNSLQLVPMQNKTHGELDKMLSVTVVCGTMLYKVEFNLFPYININIHNLTDFRQKAKNLGVQDHFGSSQLNINIVADNNITSQNIPVRLKMCDESQNNFQLLYILLIWITAMVMMALIFINNKQFQQNEKDKKGNKKRDSDHSKRDTLVSSRDTMLRQVDEVLIQSQVDCATIKNKQTEVVRSKGSMVARKDKTYPQSMERKNMLLMETIEEEDYNISKKQE